MLDRSLQGREVTLNLLKFNLQRAQQRMQIQADRKRLEREFQFSRLKPYHQKSMANRSNLKLALKYFGPFEVIARIGQFSYKLQFPGTAKVHTVFHVF